MTLSTTHCIVDIRELVTRLTDNGEALPNVVFESWLTQHYTKNWGVPCISTTMLEIGSGTYTDFARHRDLIVQRSKEQCIDPLRYLPNPDELISGTDAVWLFVKDNYLLMGDGRAIKKLWRDMCTRHE